MTISERAWESPVRNQRRALLATVATMAAAAVVLVLVVAVSYDPDDPGWGFLGLIVLILAFPTVLFGAFLAALLVLLRRGGPKAREGSTGMLVAASIGSLVLGAISVMVTLSLHPLLVVVAGAPVAAAWFAVQTLRSLDG